MQKAILKYRFPKALMQLPLIGQMQSFAWAFLIAYTQVYVGVHYPIDVIAGGLLGMLIGRLVAGMYHKQFGMLSLDN